MQEKQPPSASSSGLSQNTAATLSYVLGFITGLIFLFMEKDNKFVRYHAMQSIVLSVALLVLNTILGFIPIIGWILSILITPAALIIWILCMVKAYQGEWYEFPVAGKFSREQIEKMS
ncbi:DUF4870 domain-containing protein [Alkalicoccus halolimnae]|jgi:uncharacterized membrane protein|uniref:DUF4870 domain-containing protein n=1 Tax=Alkalicoccus halolimnae TaxID=1667239 RepID=A0A5C7FLM4_9BACI|nr:DUF4870 domain-containing protein [Alkalicoccus halolimnae]TXF85635.1 DUF4870 domain-containing protein [Alkalicoccus halolimnae]